MLGQPRIEYLSEILLPEHGLLTDNPAAWPDIARRREARRLEPGDEDVLKALRWDGCLGSQELSATVKGSARNE